MIKSLFLSNNEIIKYPIFTDKVTRLLENNKYSFIVNPKSDKFAIKSAIEDLFGVTVLKINTSNLPKKRKRMGYRIYNWKRRLLFRNGQNKKRSYRKI